MATSDIKKGPLYVDSTNNRVGVGTASPARQLTIENTIANAGGEAGILSSDSSTSGTFGTLHFGNNTDTSLASIRAKADGSTTAGKLEFNTEANGGAIETRMTIDSSGRVTMPSQPSFAATRSQGHVNNSVFVYPNVYHNTGNHYNSSNGRFTAAVAGSYFIATNHMSNNNTTHTNVQYAIRINGVNHQFVYSSSGSAVHHRWSWAGVIYLNQGDYIDVFVSSGLTLYAVSNSYTQFSGYLLG